MQMQKLSVKFPEPIQFPDGVNGEDLVLHLIAWYFYSLGNSDYALKLTGESPIELEKKLLKPAFIFLDFAGSDQRIDRLRGPVPINYRLITSK